MCFLCKCNIQSVHPHVCGEHCVEAAVRRKQIGSSPRVWGTHKKGPLNNGDLRFIPTCVGNTWLLGMMIFRYAVHPHVCGEHRYWRGCPLGWSGSSPRVWGTLKPQELLGNVDRFIPTCVGNTALGSRPGVCRPVHPHVCGEHGKYTSVRLRLIGSSPRVWGTLCLTSHTDKVVRFIPTCVGNTK